MFKLIQKLFGGPIMKFLTSEIEDSGLCDPCKQIQDLDLLMGQEEPIKHHRSWTMLCQSAESGCKMCDAFVQFQELKRFPGQVSALARDFDKDMRLPGTGLTLRPHGVNSLFILEQRALFHHPFREVVSVWFELCTSDDSSLNSLLRARHLDLSSNSDTCFRILAKWIKRCKDDHPQCLWSSNHILPTRVIDVGSETEDPFLFESSGATGEWLTLSHCWGGSVPLKTTSDTLQKHKLSIPTASLPSTFRDAILLTRKLGFKYIWIDSLCIIQNVHEDWTLESSQMFRVYANAAINLSASAAHNSNEGIFQTADQKRYLSAVRTKLTCESEIGGIRGEVGVRLQIGGNGPFVLLPEEPMHRRAWVLQESILSPRRIDFASTQLYWECRTSLHTERYPDSNDGSSFLEASGKDLYRMSPRKVETCVDLKGSANTDDLMSWWYAMLNDSYRNRGLTVDTDVLPALAGIAEEVAHRSGFHYKAGLWLEDIHRGLLWQPSTSLIRSKDEGCPSWSWASARLPARDRRLALNHYAAGYRATILDVDVKSAGENEFGRVQSAALKLACHVHAFHDWSGTNVPIYNGYGGDFKAMRMASRYLSPARAVAYVIPPAGRVLCTLDVRPENTVSRGSEIIKRGAICAQIASFKCPDRRIHNCKSDDDVTEWKNIIYGLILEPVKDGLDVYKRIGLFEIAEEDGLTEGWPPQELIVV
ncbi:uncharacterized protein RSE6_13634 [Rhynchosporium secalis]|uniref:Heterokaryon incompatibility domain-containing protein n=1 Tax=Rhynchosporium secalis TaxID=38038 RepID=A0A1E1MTA9_RHYSE|nr:uncharacterized protein RSE6_13634 [Rhynchosporium secalis]